MTAHDEHIEIERKFIVDALPTIGVGSGIRIRQGYLAQDGDAEVRVRFADAAAVLTVKIGHGRWRTEVELPLRTDDAEELWTHTEGRRVTKRRHRVDLGDLTAEVDVYDGGLAGLIVVEVEFDSNGAADMFSPPAWFGRELTGDTAWSNAALARHGRPDTDLMD